VSPQKGTSLDEVTFLVELWLREKRQLYLLERSTHTFCEHPLTARGSFRLSICRSSGGSGGGRRNDGRKDSGDYCEEQRVAMKNGTEGGVF
jgi:hypothetical protein